MSMSIPCICGKKLRVKDELAGKRVKCPACSRVVTIPKSIPTDSAAAAAMEDAAFSVLNSPEPVSHAQPPPADQTHPIASRSAVEQPQSLRQNNKPAPAISIRDALRNALGKEPTAEQLHAGEALLNAILDGARQKAKETPNDAGVWNVLGGLLAKQCRWDEAESAFRQAVKLNPNDIMHRENLALTLHHKGDLDESVMQYRAALKLKPNASTLLVLANVLFDQGKIDEAVGELKTAIRLDPKHENSHWNLAVHYFKHQQFDEARRFAQITGQLNPRHPKVHELLGEIQSKAPADPPSRGNPVVNWFKNLTKGKKPFALHEAAAEGRVDEVKSLLAEGAVVNAKDKDGHTPLHRAAIGGHVQVIEVLLEAQADVKAKSNQGYTPLHASVGKNRTKSAALLLDRGADVNAIDCLGCTALFVPVVFGHAKVVELLLSRGANPNIRDKEGKTPLHMAAAKGHNEILTLLLDHKAEIEARENTLGATPIFMAVATNNLETTERLLDRGAYINAKTKDGATVLFLAKSQGFESIAQVLQQRGARQF